MDFQDAQTAAEVRQVDDDLPIKTARTEQGGIQDVRTVRRRDHDDARIHFKAVHFNEQRIQRLLAFIMPAADSAETRTAHGVDFINENQAWGVLLAFFEHVADTARADTDEHFHEVGTADGEERHIRLSGDRLREQRLARSILSDP